MDESGIPIEGFVRPKGQVCMGVPAILGRNGVEHIVELPLDTEARIGMQKCAGAIQKDIGALRDLGLL